MKPVTLALPALLASVLVASQSCRPATREEARREVGELLAKAVGQGKDPKSGVLLVHSKSRGIHWKFAAGTTGKQSPVPTSPDQPFHGASIGKIFTAVLVLKLEESGRLSFQDPIRKFLPASTIRGLFVFGGRDHGEVVTIEQLLTHRSGVADYFSDPAGGLPALEKSLVLEPARLWKPDDLIDFTRRHQKAVGPPGSVFHYSDTGYILLGKIIESVTKQSFHKNLHQHIFDPLGMTNTFLMFHSRPSAARPLPMQNVMFAGTDVTDYASVSMDWAGGGIISTTEDLLKFHEALTGGRLVRPAAYRAMDGHSKFHSGIYYGRGHMRVNFGDILFLMKGTPELKGHSGVLGSFLYHAEEPDIFLIGSLNSSNHNEDAYELMFRVLRIARNLGPES